MPIEKPLIVVSAMKSYVKDKSGLRCSDKTAKALHRIARQAIDHAIMSAETDKRNAVMERDFEYLEIVPGISK